MAGGAGGRRGLAVRRRPRRRPSGRWQAAPGGAGGRRSLGKEAPGVGRGRCQAAPGAGGARGRKKGERRLWRPEPPGGRAVGRS